ncbi:MAG: GNAT family N-acetyltransferase [Kouleothrix sp.]|nr:GNAT family N-acetyltransferase [Kouleothrix sp.]
MRPWTLERGALWAIDVGDPLPPPCQARVQAEFAEVCGDDLEELAGAMSLPTPEPIRQRLRGGRRCFSLRIAGEIAAYGWITRGPELVGELEREFHLHDDEAYIWDCGTVPAWRGRRCYSALLSQLVRQLRSEGAPRIWIGASRLNRASICGIINAGFDPVIDLTYCRLARLTLMRISQAPTARRPLVAAAYRILLSAHERRLGQLALGYLP